MQQVASRIRALAAADAVMHECGPQHRDAELFGRLPYSLGPAPDCLLARDQVVDLYSFGSTLGAPGITDQLGEFSRAQVAPASRKRNREALQHAAAAGAAG